MPRLKRPHVATLGEVTIGRQGDTAVIEIDGRDFSMHEFGRMLTTYAGWSMRICFVPDDDIEFEPEIDVRKSDDDGQ